MAAMIAHAYEISEIDTQPYSMIATKITHKQKIHKNLSQTGEYDNGNL